MPEIWRLLPYHLGSTSLHFALSDALARLVDRPTVWWHSTEDPTIVVGPAQFGFRPEMGTGDGHEVRLVRRQAGGAAIFATRAVLGLDVALPAGHALASPDIVEAYRWLGEVWAEATSTLGAESHLVSVEEARSAQSQTDDLTPIVRQACFGSLSPYEVAVGQRKLVGLAQVRRRAGVLLQAAIHLRFDADALARAIAGEGSSSVAAALQAAAVGLDEATGSPCGKDAVIETFQSVLQRRLQVQLQPGRWTDREWSHALEQEDRTARQARPAR